MDTVDPLIWFCLVAVAAGSAMALWATIMSRRYDRKFGRERDRSKAP